MVGFPHVTALGAIRTASKPSKAFADQCTTASPEAEQAIVMDSLRRLIIALGFRRASNTVGSILANGEVFRLR
jgi:hypothetical protein